MLVPGARSRAGLASRGPFDPAPAQRPFSYGWLQGAALLEFKSPSRGFRNGDLIRLLGYGVQYHYKERRVLVGPSELTLALVVPCLTPPLEAEAGDYLRIFSHLQVQGREARAWLQHWLVEKGTMENVRHTDDYDEMMEKLLGMLTPEQRLRGL